MQYDHMNPTPLNELADWVKGNIKGDPHLIIHDILPLNLAGSNDLSFIESAKYIKKAGISLACAFLAFPGLEIAGKTIVEVANPRLAYVKLLQLCCRVKQIVPSIHQSAYIATSAIISNNASVGPYVVIEDGVKIGAGTVIMAGTVIQENAVIGKDCWIHPNVIIGHGCIIKDRVIIYGGTVIGADGFGYVQDNKGEHLKVPQRGKVVLEDDVEVGANTTIDRAVAGETRVRRGTKIDNLVQIAHNVQVGENCVLTSQVGIAGSAKIGSRVIIGGQAGVGEHLKVGNGAIIGAQGGVIGDIPDDSIVSGYPARPHREQMRILGALQQLPSLLNRIKHIEEQLSLKDKIKNIT